MTTNTDRFHQALRLAEKEILANLVTDGARDLVKDMNFLISHSVKCRIPLGTDVRIMAAMLVDAVSNALLDKEEEGRLTHITPDSEPWKHYVETNPAPHWVCTRTLVLVVRKSANGKVFTTNGLMRKDQLQVFHGVHQICASEDELWIARANKILSEKSE